MTKKNQLFSLKHGKWKCKRETETAACFRGDMVKDRKLSKIEFWWFGKWGMEKWSGEYFSVIKFELLIFRRNGFWTAFLKKFRWWSRIEEIYSWKIILTWRRKMEHTWFYRCFESIPWSLESSNAKTKMRQLSQRKGRIKDFGKHNGTLNWIEVMTKKNKNH